MKDLPRRVFPVPWRVEVDPLGPSPDGVPNIFVVASDGCLVLTVNKHPVYEHMSKERQRLAQELIELVNDHW
jgi:hypothetical protein